MSSSSWLMLTPRDTVFVRDGRSFQAATADFVAHTVRPWPSTVAGAVRAAFGGTDPNPDEVRGPVLGRSTRYGFEPYFPVPADLLRSHGDAPSVYRLVPESISGLTDLDDGPEQWLAPPEDAPEVEPLSGWIPGPELHRYLTGQLVPDGGRPLAELGLEPLPLKPEARVGIARGENRVVKPGFFYRVTHLRPDDGWSFAVQYVVPDTWNRHAIGPVQLGGRGRLADVDPAPGDVQWPGDPEAVTDARVLVYLATPAIWPTGWRIPVPSGARLVAAAVGEPEPVATISPGRGWRTSRALRWAVPAGSVYLLEFEDVEQARAWAGERHATAYGLQANDMTRTAGFGVVLIGVW